FNIELKNAFTGLLSARVCQIQSPPPLAFLTLRPPAHLATQPSSFPTSHHLLSPQTLSRDVAWDVGGAIDYHGVAMPPLTTTVQLLLCRRPTKVASSSAIGCSDPTNSF
ncbi:hypothetical protein A2U01_0056535, partial [Trifolium medium]|nr:hypothetical protein [Trifolium medium]